MIEPIVLAYLAGAMDSDGYFTIKRSTYHMRVRGDAKNPVFSEKIGLHQVTPEVPHLLKECFGGVCSLSKPANENSKALWRFTATDKNAAIACEMLLPYLRIKRKQAETLLELRESKTPKYEQLAYWFQQDNPDWRSFELITASAAAKLLGYINLSSVSQAIYNGTLIATDAKAFRTEAPKIPLKLVEQIIANGNARIKPPQLIEWRESLHNKVREFNKLGINGTSVYFRTGVHTPA